MLYLNRCHMVDVFWGIRMSTVYQAARSELLCFFLKNMSKYLPLNASKRLNFCLMYCYLNSLVQKNGSTKWRKKMLSDMSLSCLVVD